jgi:hypothetical protein
MMQVLDEWLFLLLLWKQGFLLTNMAIFVANPAFTETVKSAEPISSVILAAAMLRERISAYKWLTVMVR